MQKTKNKNSIKFYHKLLKLGIFKTYLKEKISSNEDKTKQPIDSDKAGVYNRFYEVNSKYWSDIEHDKTSGRILVEGFFAESGPNYVTRIGSITKALEEVTKAQPLVLLRIGVKNEAFNKKIWSSYKLNDYIGIAEDIQPNYSQIKFKFLSKIYYYYSKFLIFTKQLDKFLALSYKGIQFGDILYDEMIKHNRRKIYTINTLSKKDIRYFESVFDGFFYSEYLWKNYDIRYYVTTHIQYIAYGLIVRFLRSKGVPVIESTDDILFLYDDENKHITPKFHPYIQDLIKGNFEKIYNNEELLNEANDELHSRFNATTEQIDVKLAYGNKKTYSKDELKEKLGINNTNPIVYIFAHIFADVPAAANDFQLFPDYYLWLNETIEKCADIKHINWVIKEHPSVNAYDEQGEVAKIVEKYKKSDSTLFLCPDDFSTASLKETAKAIVTAQGTVGLEFSCIGIPTVITSAGFYHGFGFTIEPQSKEAYFNQLENIQDLSYLSAEQQKTALTIFKAFKLLNNTDFSLIDTEVKALTWGSNGKPNILGAFDIVTERLKNIDPKTKPLYNTIKQRYK